MIGVIQVIQLEIGPCQFFRYIIFCAYLLAYNEKKRGYLLKV